MVFIRDTIGKNYFTIEVNKMKKRIGILICILLALYPNLVLGNYHWIVLIPEPSFDIYENETSVIKEFLSNTAHTESKLGGLIDERIITWQYIGTTYCYLTDPEGIYIHGKTYLFTTDRVHIIQATHTFTYKYDRDSKEFTLQITCRYAIHIDKNTQKISQVIHHPTKKFIKETYGVIL